MTRVFAVFILLTCISMAAADPCKSGPQPNQRPGPYSSLVCVGKERGTQHCYICESADRPIIVVFARTPGDSVGKLVKKLDAENPGYFVEWQRLRMAEREVQESGDHRGAA